MRRSGVAIAIWLLLAALAALVVARAHYTGDLSAFLPKAPSPAQQLLVDELREGPASRLILLAIDGADAPTRARLSRALAARLRSDGTFRAVTNGAAATSERDREFIFAHRYLLSASVNPQRFTVVGLRAAIRNSIDLLASPLGLLAQDLFVRDPTGETLQVLAELNRTAQPQSEDGVWVSRNRQRALLVAATRASGSDTDGQARAIEAIERAFAAAERTVMGAHSATAQLTLSGPGVFAVRARATIEHEAIRLAVLGSLLVATLLFAVYRSLPALLLGLLPVATGALVGVAAVALAFGVVYGVTLGFGATLIGESVDYSVYLFIQARHEPGSSGAPAIGMRTLWRTIRLGVLTSVCGFASLLPSGFPGLAQLGVYSIAGLVAAALVTRFVLPDLLPRDLALRTAVPIGRRFARCIAPLRQARLLLWVIAIIAGLTVYTARDRLWNRDLTALSPVSAADQALDASLRADLGAPDVSTLIVLSAADADAALRSAESAAVTLEPLMADGAIGGFETPSRYLPSLATQAFRRASLPPGNELRQRLAAAVARLPVQADRLQPFIADVAAARRGPLLRRPDLEGTSLAAGVDALLFQRGGLWTALLPLRAPIGGPHAGSIDVVRVRHALAAVAIPGVTVVVLDLKRASDALYATYLFEAVRLSIGGLCAILVVLLIALRSVQRVARVMAPLMLAVLMVMAGLAIGHHPMTILHLIGMLLIVAIGSNYALFFDRESANVDAHDAARMLASLLVANCTAVIGFGVLSLSTVPVLAALGATVAPGVLLALLLSAVLAKDLPAAAGRS